MERLQKVLLTAGILLLLIQTACAAGTPQAIFQTHGGEWVNTDNNTFRNDTYLARYENSVSIQNSPDSSGTVLGNITYSLDMDNVINFDHKAFATKKGSLIRWVFPKNVTLPENSYILSGAKSDYIYPRYIPITVQRGANKSVFSSDGYELVTFFVKYDNVSLADANLTFNGIWGGIFTNENAEMNATILPETFRTDLPVINNPMARKNGHFYEFSTSSTSVLPPVKPNKIYNISVIIHIHIKDNSGKAIQYYPKFSTALRGGLHTNNYTLSRNAETPSFMLPAHVHSAKGSTNTSNQWCYSFGFLRGVRLNETFEPVSSVPPTVNAIQPVFGKQGALVLITNLSGTGFKTGAKVFFNKTGSTSLVATNITVVNAKKITCTVKIPAAAVIGPWNVMVMNTDGKSGTKANAFLVKTPVPPTVTGITPASGRRGTLVAVTNLSGTGFVASPKPTVQLLKGTVTITATNVTVVSQKKITCTFIMPAGAATGLWNARVTNADRQAGTKAGAFTVNV